MTKQKLISPILMWIIVFAGIAAIFTIAPKTLLFPRTIFNAFILVLAILYFVYLFVSAFHAHPRAARSVAGIEKIITRGIYARVRHPFYSAEMALAWGLFIYFPSMRMLVCVVWLTAVLIFWMKLEEQALTEKFDAEYKEYRSAVPMLIPRFLRRPPNSRTPS